MSEEERNELLNYLFNRYHRDYLAPILENMDSRMEKLRDDIKKEHEDLLIRAVNAETKLKMYEAIFSKLNLNMEVKNE